MAGRCAAPGAKHPPLDAPSPCCVGPQTFSGSPLSKPDPLPRTDAIASSHAQFLLAHGRAFAVLDLGDVKVPEMCWLTQTEIARAGDLQITPEGDVRSNRDDRQLLPLFLGKTEEGQLCYAISMFTGNDAAKDQLKTHLRGMGLKLIPMRAAMRMMPQPDLAVAGNAIALAGWHQATLFCSKCGSPTTPTALGAKRVCVVDSSHRFYPRTDPAVIMLVEDPSGSRVLLGRRTGSAGGAFTALSGFIDAGETIEEAVRREVREEAGIKVGAVSILGSQPWPIGRSGSNELMIGCFAKALSETITINVNENTEVGWYDREQCRDAIKNSLLPENPFAGGRGSEDGERFYVPPPFAIAHHLVKAWVNKAYGECDARL